MIACSTGCTTGWALAPHALTAASLLALPDAQVDLKNDIALNLSKLVVAVVERLI